jgi:hypothetical protein
MTSSKSATDLDIAIGSIRLVDTHEHLANEKERIDCGAECFDLNRSIGGQR